MSRTIEAPPPPAPRPDLPIEARISIPQTWIGALVSGAVLLFIVASTPPDLRLIALPLFGALAGLSVLEALVDTLDRRRRFVLDHDGLSWRTGPFHLFRRRVAWTEVRGAAFQFRYRAPDLLRLRLADGRRRAIQVEGLTIDGKDLPGLIKTLAPHVEIPPDGQATSAP